VNEAERGGDYYRNRFEHLVAILLLLLHLQLWSQEAAAAAYSKIQIWMYKRNVSFSFDIRQRTTYLLLFGGRV